MMEIYVEGRRLRIDTDDVLVAGSVGGYAVHFSFGPGWQNDAVVAVFEANESVSREVVIPPDGVVGIPWEVLTEAGSLRIGVYSVGVDGVKPTVWSTYQQVYPGTEPADPPEPYESTPWQEAVSYMGDTMNETKEASEAAVLAAQGAAASEGQAQGHAQSAAESANAAETAKESAETAWQNIQALDAEAETLAPEEAATAEYDKALNKLLFGIPKGNKGDKGDQGVSPTVTVSKTGKVTTVTITDKDGTKTFYINDGMDGEGAGDMLKSTYDADGDGVVDKAESATYATNAGIASRANSAASADTAHSATNATNATNAANASKLGGELPSAYRKTADQIDYLTEVQNKPTIDTAVTEGSANAVSSGAVKTYVDGKLETLNVIDLDSFNVSFPATGWTQEPGLEWEVYQQLAPVEGIAYTDYLSYDINLPYNPETREALLQAWAGLISISIVDGSGLLARFGTAPTVDMSIAFNRTRKNTQ